MKVIWFAMDCNIYTHPKTLQLAQALKLDVDTAVGKLGRLWSWAKASRNETGDIGFLPDQEIADIMRWKKKADTMVTALVECGFLDVETQGKFLHGWVELNGDLCANMRRDNERKSKKNSVEIPPEIPEKFYGKSTPTVPNRTLPEKILTTSSVCAQVRDEGLGRVMTSFLEKISPTASQSSLEQLKGYVSAMGAEVCMRAIDSALDAGSGKANWSYIGAILRNLQRQGVKCLADMEQLEAEHEAQKAVGTASAGKGAPKGAGITFVAPVPDPEANQRAREDWERMRKFMRQQRESEPG